MIVLNFCLSRFINKNYFRCNLNLLFYLKRIIKSSKPASGHFCMIGSMMMMMMIMMMNCFCGMVDRQKELCLIFSRDHFQRSSGWRISDTPRRGVWACAEPDFKLCWMNMCNCGNHYTTAPLTLLDFLSFELEMSHQGV